MKSFIPLSQVLDSIPSALFEEESEASFYDRFLDALRLLPDVLIYEPKIELFEIVGGRVQLPKYVKQINSVRWQESNPSEEDICSISVPEGQDTNPDVCKPMITYQMWLDSPYFKNNYVPLKFVGTDKSLISNSCENLCSGCSESFVVTPQKTMYLSIDSGFICVNYNSPVCDEEGNILIPDNQLLVEYLVAFAISKHWENRMFTKETQAANFYQDYRQKQALLFRQVRGELFLAQTNIRDIVNVNGQFTKLIKLPELLFYAR